MKTDEPKFLEMYFWIPITGGASFWVLPSLPISTNGFPSAFDIAFVFSASAVINILIAFKRIKPKLLEIYYDGENVHLFSKYIALQELLITVGIAFLIGIVPAFCEYNHIPTDAYQRYVATIASLWLACVANTYKCMFAHTRNVWIANHSARIYEESNAAFKTKNSKK